MNTENSEEIQTCLFWEAETFQTFRLFLLFLYFDLNSLFLLGLFNYLVSVNMLVTQGL